MKTESVQCPRSKGTSIPSTSREVASCQATLLCPAPNWAVHLVDCLLVSKYLSFLSFEPASSFPGSKCTYSSHVRVLIFMTRPFYLKKCLNCSSGIAIFSSMLSISQLLILSNHILLPSKFCFICKEIWELLWTFFFFKWRVSSMLTCHPRGKQKC